jgi:glycosyltransferase involved in cell wall biosynthesis
MKILLATQYFLHPSCNGASQLSRRVAKALSDLGHEVRILCLNGILNHKLREQSEFTATEEEQDGLHVYTMPYPLDQFGDGKPLALFRYNALRNRCVNEIIRAWTPDVLSVISLGGMRDAIKIAKNRGIPVTLTTIDFMLICPRMFLLKGDGSLCMGDPSVAKCLPCLKQNESKKSQLATNLVRWNFSRQGMRFLLGKDRFNGLDWGSAISEVIEVQDELRGFIDAFIAPAPIAREMYEKHGVNSQLITDMVYSLPDFKLECSMRDDEGAGKQRNLRIGYIGRPSYEKGFQVILESFIDVNVEGAPQPELWIAGAGLNIEKLMEYSINREEVFRVFKENRIRLFENLDDKKLRDLMAQLDFCVIPSICHECCPLVLLEAIAQKTPCIGSDIGGVRHMIRDRVNGALFPPGDSSALTELISDIVRNPDVLAIWRKNLPSISDDSIYAGRMVEIYQSAINRNKESKNSFSLN